MKRLIPLLVIGVIYLASTTSTAHAAKSLAGVLGVKKQQTTIDLNALLASIDPIYVVSTSKSSSASGAKATSGCNSPCFGGSKVPAYSSCAGVGSGIVINVNINIVLNINVPTITVSGSGPVASKSQCCCCCWGF